MFPQNNILKLLLSFLIIAYALSACDEIEAPYKKTALTPVDTTGILTGKTMSDTVDKKVVLLEDFTGHT